MRSFKGAFQQRVTQCCFGAPTGGNAGDWDFEATE